MKRGLFLLALLPACASLGRDPASELVGCYQFRYDQGSRELDLPWGFELLDEPLEPGWTIGIRFPDARTATTATSATTREEHPLGYWRELPGDTIELGHPSGFGGFRLRLGRQGQDLVGWGSTVGDVGGPGEGPPPAHPVTAYRVVCGIP